MAEVEIEASKAHERPYADAYRTDPDNHSMAQGCGLDSLADRALEHGSQQHRGQACDQCGGDCSCEPPSPACSKRHRRRMPHPDSGLGQLRLRVQTRRHGMGNRGLPHRFRRRGRRRHAPARRDQPRWQDRGHPRPATRTRRISATCLRSLTTAAFSWSARRMTRARPQASTASATMHRSTGAEPFGCTSSRRPRQHRSSRANSVSSHRPETMRQ